MRDVIGRMRWGMRDVIGEMGGGYAGRYWKDEVGDMRDGPPPRNRPGRAAVFGPAPPIHKGRETRTVNDLRAEKRMIILCLTC